MVASHPRPESAVFHRRPGDAYPVFVRGEGCQLWDATGKRYVDLTSGMAWAASLGQGRQEIADVMATQAASLTYIQNAWASTDRQEEYATRLTALAPAGITRAMFTSGGSESNELAIRIVRQYQLAVGQPDRWKIVSLQHSYHGATVGALSLTGAISVNEMMATDYDPYLIKFPRVPGAHHLPRAVLAGCRRRTRRRRPRRPWSRASSRPTRPRWPRSSRSRSWATAP